MSGAEGWLLVTAAYNEAGRLGGLASSLQHQESGLIARWVIVDDGSTDGTAEVARSLEDLGFPVTVLTRPNGGGLARASELSAFRDGVAAGLALEPHAVRIMKIDADLRLEVSYLALLKDYPDNVGLVGGVIDQADEVAQQHHVRGGLRAYSRAAWTAASELPVALGWDVLDQVMIRSAGMDVIVVPSARARTSRTTGSSAGLWAGRTRLGVVCRWTGYHPAYLLLKWARTFSQRPVGLGGLAFAMGYLRAERSPYSADLIAAHRQEQWGRLRHIVLHPRGVRRRLYPSR